MSVELPGRLRPAQIKLHPSDGDDIYPNKAASAWQKLNGTSMRISAFSWNLSGSWNMITQHLLEGFFACQWNWNCNWWEQHFQNRWETSPQTLFKLCPFISTHCRFPVHHLPHQLILWLLLLLLICFLQSPLSLPPRLKNLCQLCLCPAVLITQSECPTQLSPCLLLKHLVSPLPRCTLSCTRCTYIHCMCENIHILWRSLSQKC